MKLSVFAMFFLIQGFHAFSQQKLTGIVTCTDDGKPVPYASIGITRMTDGTVSNADGTFSIILNKDVTGNDTLKFSSIGYKSEAYLIGELKDKAKKGGLSISLNRATDQLKPVVVTSGKAHVKIAGYDKDSKLFGLGFYTSGVGSQAGVVIPITHPQTNLQNVSFYIIQNPFKHLLFRVNMYKMENDKPGSNLLNENILIHTDNNQTGKVTFDLSKYDLYADSDVLITLEWLTADPADNARLVVAASVFGHTWYRQASQSVWTKKGAGVGISVKTVY